MKKALRVDPQEPGRNCYDQRNPQEALQLRADQGVDGHRHDDPAHHPRLVPHLMQNQVDDVRILERIHRVDAVFDIGRHLQVPDSHGRVRVGRADQFAGEHVLEAGRRHGRVRLNDRRGLDLRVDIRAGRTRGRTERHRNQNRNRCPHHCLRHCPSHDRISSH